MERTRYFRHFWSLEDHTVRIHDFPNLEAEDGQFVVSGSSETLWEFNDHGDDVVYRGWYQWSTETPDTSATRYSGFFNGLPIPEEVPYPAAFVGLCAAVFVWRCEPLESVLTLVQGDP